MAKASDVNDKRYTNDEIPDTTKTAEIAEFAEIIVNGIG